MTVAVTGATGVVGGSVLRHLLDRGQEVRALVRPGRILPAEVEPVLGDVLDPDSLKRCFAGADTVFHVAGVNQLCGRNPARLVEVNVEGTRLVADAAAGARLVHTSSAAALGEAEGEIGAEDTRPTGMWNSDYARSKWEAEQILARVAKRQDIVVVNPSSVQGPGRATGTGRLLIGLMRGRLRLLVDTRVSIVDIDDCARGHLLAAEHGRPGERYVLNSFSMTMSEVVALLGKVIGGELSVRYVPAGLLKAAGVVAGGIFRLLGRDAPLCPESVRTLLHGHTYDGSRASRELGLRYTPADVTFRRLYEWAQESGRL